MECLVYKTIKRIPFSQKRIQKILKNILQDLNIESNISLSIHLVGKQKIKTLNRLYRGQDKVTDVISFANQEGENFDFEEQDLGDIFICLDKIRIQAKEFKVSFKEEFLRLLIHGLLHLLGYDHQKKSQAELMFKLQEDLLNKYYDQF